MPTWMPSWILPAVVGAVFSFVASILVERNKRTKEQQDRQASTMRALESENDRSLQAEKLRLQTAQVARDKDENDFVMAFLDRQKVVIDELETAHKELRVQVDTLQREGIAKDRRIAALENDFEKQRDETADCQKKYAEASSRITFLEQQLRSPA